MAQVQCPNCGGYRVRTELKKVGTTKITTTVKEVGLGTRILAIVLCIIGLGLPLLAASSRDIIFRGKILPMDLTVPERAEHNTCWLCGYEWVWHPGTPQPMVSVRPDLIAKGEQRLREEEENARANAIAQDTLRRQGIIK